jgi:hypothetical protein
MNTKQQKPRFRFVDVRNHTAHTPMQKKLLHSKALITHAVTFHALADTIEALATDCNMQQAVDIVKEIRKEADRYGDTFGDFSDDMRRQIAAHRYNNRQLLPALVAVLATEAKKVDQRYKGIDPCTEFNQNKHVAALKALFAGEFVSKQMVITVQQVIVDMREHQFND